MHWNWRSCWAVSDHCFILLLLGGGSEQWKMHWLLICDHCNGLYIVNGIDTRAHQRQMIRIYVPTSRRRQTALKFIMRIIFVIESRSNWWFAYNYLLPPCNYIEEGVWGGYFWGIELCAGEIIVLREQGSFRNSKSFRSYNFWFPRTFGCIIYFAFWLWLSTKSNYIPGLLNLVLWYLWALSLT